MRKVFIIIRYSVFQNEKFDKLWKPDLDEYKAALFAEDRLTARSRGFDDITARTLAALHVPKDIDMKILVVASTLLPNTWKEQLEITASGLPRMEIIYIRPEEKFNSFVRNEIELRLSTINEQTAYATVCLDDDDGLASDYLERLSKYIDQKYSGFVVSFPSGLFMSYNSRKREVIDLRFAYDPKTALGMALIGVWSGYSEAPVASIYQISPHTLADAQYPVILDAASPVILRVQNGFNLSTLSHGEEWFTALPRAHSRMLVGYGLGELKISDRVKKNNTENARELAPSDIVRRATRATSYKRLWQNERRRRLHEQEPEGTR